MLGTADGVTEGAPNEPSDRRARAPRAPSLHVGVGMRGPLEPLQLFTHTDWKADAKTCVGSEGPGMARTGLGKKAAGGLTLLQACQPAAGAARLCVTGSHVQEPSHHSGAQGREQRAPDQGRGF